MKKRKFIISLGIVVLALAVSQKSGRGTITSITLTPANPTTLSNGLGYYLAGKAYTFTVNVVDPDCTAWANVTEVRVTIPSGMPAGTNNVVFRAHTFVAGPSCTGQIVSGNIAFQAGSPTVAGTFNNFTVTFIVVFQWEAAATYQTDWHNTSNITASATTALPAPNTLTDPRPVSYGISSTIKIINFAQSGDAADGRVNPWHTTFNVTGNIVYNVTGATDLDEVHDRADLTTGEITDIVLIHSSGSTINDDDDNEANLSVPVPASWMNDTPGWANARGNRTWSIRCTMTNPVVNITSANTLAINCDRIQITNILFIGGGGVDPGVRYYRSVNVPGTQVRVFAQMEDSTGPMVGNTTIRIGEFLGTDVATGITTDVIIANGSNTGIANLTYPVGLPANDTTPLRYGAIRVFGGAYDGDTALAEGQYIITFVPANPAPLRITQPAYPAYIIYWDNNDPPGDNAADFTAWGGLTVTATAITLNWAALDPMTYDDHDFYSYRIYYRQNGATLWTIIDRNTPNYSTPGPYFLDVIGTTTATIAGLVPLTTYEYFVSAVDVFGNEVYTLFPNSVIHGNATPPPEYGTVQTLALSILCEITDGVTRYPDSSFTASYLAAARPVRPTAIEVKFTIEGTTTTLPDTVNIIAALDPGPAEPPAQYLYNGINLNGVEGTNYFRYPCSKAGPNTWKGYIPSTNTTLITLGTNVRFILEMKKGPSTTYADHNSELEDPLGANDSDPTSLPNYVTPNDWEWNFRVETATTFTPWPTRILNNVITEKNPVAYPAFYLTEDAYVSIKVYDIKGRPVTTLLDGAFRRGGQNIKEDGWNGTNKSNRKVGVGLYYVHIRAKSAVSGKVILNSFQKVVMAR